MEWLGENGIPFSIIITKIDKQSNAETQRKINRYKKKLQEVWEELPPILTSSSEKAIGREEILSYIEQIMNL